MGLTKSFFKQARIIGSLFLFAFFLSSANASQKILVWGDSLSAAYGIPVEKGWVNLMRQQLGNDVEIINGSISGETTQGGRTRLPAALEIHQPALIIFELGANDGLRGLPPAVTKGNLKKMIESAQLQKTKIILLGMKIPPNYGIAYSQQFEQLFADLAEVYKLPFIPFFLEDIIENLALLQADELHPTAQAQPLLLKKILPMVKDSLIKLHE